MSYLNVTKDIFSCIRENTKERGIDMDTELMPVESQPLQPIQDAQADSDEQVIALWLHGKAERTQEVYGADIGRFGDFVRQPLHRVKLRDIHAYADNLGHLAPATQARMLATVKSLFAFAHKRIGYLPFDVAGSVKLPRLRARWPTGFCLRKRCSDCWRLRPIRGIMPCCDCCTQLGCACRRFAG